MKNDKEHGLPYIPYATRTDMVLYAALGCLNIILVCAAFNFVEFIPPVPYEHISKERILEALTNLHNSKELFELDDEVQRRAAAFYLDAKGQTSYRDTVSQTSADKLLEEWRTITNTPKITSQ